MFSITGSLSALFASILACLTLMFVWGGTSEVQFSWVGMSTDYDVVALQIRRNPMPEALPTGGYDPVAAGDNAAPPVLNGDNYVLWLAISGFRSDYMEKAETPFLDGIGGKSTNQLVPTFPALSWSSLMSQATGRTSDGHGISGNVMRLPGSGEVVKHPSDLSLLKAEPIWTSARKAGLPVLVHDWPFSQKQPAEGAADVFLPSYDPELDDQTRLDALYDAWSSYQGENKLRLVMGSLRGIHKAAQTNGTREEDTITAIQDMDKMLSGFFGKVINNWPNLSNEGDKLYVVITTDHGMVDAEKLINFKDLMGPMADQVDYTVDEGVAHLWFKDPPEGVDKDEFIESYDSELKKRIYWRSFAPSDYPSDWKLAAEGGHLGDRLLLLKPPYAFHTESGSEGVYAPAETGGPFAASGYWVNDSSRMKGQMFSFGLAGGGGFSGDLGEVSGTQLYPSVCKLLGVEVTSDLVESNVLDLE
ncbi:MAG: hypothetical protein ACI8UO_002577 [Verrucomicrobiales bacterium]|jgi:hypothetical protein